MSKGWEGAEKVRKRKGEVGNWKESGREREAY